MQQPSPHLAIAAAEVAAHNGLTLRWACQLELAGLGARRLATHGQSDVLRPACVTLAIVTGRPVENGPTIPQQGVAG